MLNHRTLTAAMIDSREFIAARRRAETQLLVPAGTRIAFTGGIDCNDHDRIWAALDRVHAKHPDMVLLHGGAPRGPPPDRIALIGRIDLLGPVPDITYMLVEHDVPIKRRIYTDGRDWPKEIDPTYQGYSIGRWIDSTGSGHHDVLEVETRGFKGVRSYDNSGLPLHTDNRSIIRERIFQDRADPNVLHDEMTTFDHALTRPWNALKTYRRNAEKYPVWLEENCPAITRLTKIGNEVYFKGADGELLPTRKDQPPPDLKFFKETRH